MPALTVRGLVATCTGCGKLMGSRDRFCPSCGAAAGASPADANGADEPAEPLEEPDFGDTIEAAALNGSEAEEQRAEGRRAEPANPGNGEPETGAEGAIPISVQRKMRAGRRMARQWLEQRRSDGP